VTARRQFLLECGKAFAALVFAEACEQEKLLRPKPRPITPDFFGHMVQGEWVLDDGTLARAVTVYFGVLRLWDSRAVWWKMETDPNALAANLRYAESVGADTMFVFGEPPQSAFAPGKLKMPTKDAWLAFVKQIARERIRYVELWNEPAEGYWDGTPEELAEYCRVAYPILESDRQDGSLAVVHVVGKLRLRVLRSLPRGRRRRVVRRDRRPFLLLHAGHPQAEVPESRRAAEEASP
jgi:hypothetical protein